MLYRPRWFWGTVVDLTLGSILSALWLYGIYFAVLSIALLTGPSIASAQWVPPIGIPAPSFGITEVAPAFPNPWTATVPDFYYVCPTCPAATNTANTNGWPAKPRLTIPTTITPVSGPVVVQVVGVYATAHDGGLNMNGTVTNPIFIRGTSDAVRGTFTKKWSFLNPKYLIVEYLNADWTTSGNGKIEIHSLTGNTSHHVSFRHLSLKGDAAATGGILFFSIAPYAVNNIVVWNSEIYDGGDWQSPLDQDVHGISFGLHVSDVWIVDSTFYHLSGNAMQIGSGTTGTLPASTAPKRIYVGRNHAYETKQDPFFSKQATDVIFSQNLAHNIRRDGGSSTGGCYGFQYGPEFVWFLFNVCHTSVNGLNLQSASGGFGTVGYAIGNVFYNIHFDPNLFHFAQDLQNPHNSQGTCITNRGMNSFHVINNTCSGYDGGFYSPATGTSRIVNNIFEGRNTALAGYDYFRDITDGTSTVKNNDFFAAGGIRLRRGGATFTTVASFETAMGASLGSGNLNVNPLFVGGGSYALQASSPLVNTGLSAADQAYADFQARYGRSIQVDHISVVRPVGGWDIGAFEFSAATRTLTILHAGTGTGTTTPAPGNYGYADGASVTLTNTPAVGSIFVGWTGTGCTTGVVLMSVNRACTATFNSSGTSHTLTIAAYAGTGTGTTTPVPGTYSFADGTVVTLTASPAAGSTFGGWTGTGCTTGTVTMTTDRTCTPTFHTDRTLTIVHAGTGTGTTNPAPGPTAYVDNTVVTLQATPAAGSTFSGWTGTGCTTGTVTMSTNRTCTATFTLSAPQRTLTIAAHAGTGTGTTTPVPGAYSFADGAVVTLAASPAAGSIFAGWSGTGCTTGTVTMSTDRTCTATFNTSGGVNHTLTIAAYSGSGTGTTTPVPGAYVYVENTVVVLTANPAAGSTFSGWSGTGCTTGTVTMSVDRTCTPIFTASPTQRTLTITPRLGNGDGITTPSPGSYFFADGVVVTLIATPNGGSVFTGWSGVGCTTGIVTMSQDRTCTATFQIQAQISGGLKQFMASRVYSNSAGVANQYALVGSDAFLNDALVVPTAPGVPVMGGFLSGTSIQGTYAAGDGYANTPTATQQYRTLGIFLNESSLIVPSTGGTPVTGGSVAVGGNAVQ